VKRFIIQKIDPRRTLGMMRVVGESNSLSYCLRRISEMASAYVWDNGYCPLPESAEPFLIFRVYDEKAEKVAHVSIYMEGCHTIISKAAAQDSAGE
jgi:uncharacterized protein involved in tolerance to divalent cations